MFPAFRNEINELETAFERLRRTLDGKTAELLRTNEIMAAANLRHEAIFESVADAIIILDRELRITIMNKTAEEFCLASSAGASWEPFEQMFPRLYDVDHHSVPLQNSPWRLVERNRRTERIRGFLERYDGKIFSVLISASPMVREGELVGFVLALHDITEELKAEESLREFAATASHQLRTPLASIQWFLELVLSKEYGEMNQKQWEFIYQAYQAAQRITNSINLLLSLSKIETGALGIRPFPQNLVEAIQEEIGSVMIFAKRKNQKLFFEAGKNLNATVAIDRALFTTVFENLLSNAIKYTPDEGTIEVALRQQGDYMVISVKDTGVGIPDEVKEKIFSKFFRAENVVLISQEGSGLGLYIVKRLVEAWGGTIWFESRLGTGSTFFFTVPLGGMVPLKHTEVPIGRSR